MDNQLIKTIKESELDKNLEDLLNEKFQPFFKQTEEWKNKAETIKVTDISQREDMKMARIARIALSKIRIEANKTRVFLKEDSLKYGKTVQQVYNIIESKIKPIEFHLEQQEKFIQIQEAKIKEELRINRISKLGDLITLMPSVMKIEDLTEDEFNSLYNMTKAESLRLKEKEEKELREKQEAEQEAEQKAKEEQERINLENAKLKAAAEARELEFAKEREKAKEEAAQKERELAKEREKAEAESKEKERIIASARNKLATAQSTIKNKIKSEVKRAIHEKIEKEKTELQNKLREEKEAQLKEDSFINFHNNINEASPEKILANIFVDDIFKNNINDPLVMKELVEKLLLDYKDKINGKN